MDFASLPEAAKHAKDDKELSLYYTYRDVSALNRCNNCHCYCLGTTSREVSDKRNWNYFCLTYSQDVSLLFNGYNKIRWVLNKQYIILLRPLPWIINNKYYYVLNFVSLFCSFQMTYVKLKRKERQNYVVWSYW